MHVIAFYGHLGFEVIHSWSSPGSNMEKCAILNRSTIIHLKKSSDYPYCTKKRNWLLVQLQLMPIIILLATTCCQAIQ